MFTDGMFSGDALRERLGELREVMTESHRRIAEARRAAEDRRVTVRAPDGEASLELDGTGGVRSLVFHDDAYRDLEPEELAEMIVDLFTRAQAEVRTTALEALPPSPVTGLTPRQLLDPGTDIAALIPDDLLADAARPARLARLRPPPPGADEGVSP